MFLYNSVNYKEVIIKIIQIKHFFNLHHGKPAQLW